MCLLFNKYCIYEPFGVVLMKKGTKKIKASILDGQSSFRFTKMFKSLLTVGKHFYVTLNGLTLVCELLCHFFMKMIFLTLTT